MAFESLSRRHAIKIGADNDISVEECSLAVGSIVGYGSVVSASRMNRSVVLFLDSVDKVNTIVEQGIVVNDTFVNVLPLVTPARRVTLSNVPPFITDEFLERELARHGKLVSSIKKIPLGCKSPLLKHVVSFRRHVYMILNGHSGELNVKFQFQVDNFQYMIFASTDNMKCFFCGKEGHGIRSCPEKNIPAKDAQADKEGKSANGGQSRTTGDAPVNREEDCVDGEHGGLMGDAPTNRDNGNHDHSGSAEEHNGETRPSSGPEGAVTDNIPVGTENKTNCDATVENGESMPIVENNESLQANVSASNDTMNLMMDKITSDLMNGKGENAVTEHTEPLFCADDAMEDEQVSAKKPKRKTNTRDASKNAKKFANESRSDNLLVDLDNDSDYPSCSPSPRPYNLKMIKSFLGSTKNIRGVKVEEHFPDVKAFSTAVQHFKHVKGNFTEQEGYRLNKLLTKINQQVDENDGNGTL